MEPIKTFGQLTAHLKRHGKRQRVAVVCGRDASSQYAIMRALKEGIAEFILVGDASKLDIYPELNNYEEFVRKVDIPNPDEAVREAIRLIRAGEADILMKGIINTDNLLRAVLDKEMGLMPETAADGTAPKHVLTHMTMMQIPTYHKLLFFSDAAVIPYPKLEQRIATIGYDVDVCRRFGIAQPRIALIHCTEKVSEKFPVSLDYVEILRRAKEGIFGDVIIDGPIDTRCACDRESEAVKGIASPLGGDTDILIFPDIEAANCFYKAVTLFAHADMAGMLQGTRCPVVLPSRSDSGLTKFYSLAMACQANHLTEQPQA
jgi:phosphate butyryltransferase